MSCQTVTKYPKIIPYILCWFGSLTNEFQSQTMVLFSAWVMGRDPTVWEEPLVFKPERFDDPEGPHKTLYYVPFHAGPQTCMLLPSFRLLLSLWCWLHLKYFIALGLGRPMAYMEAKTMLSILLSKYSFKVSPGHPVSCFHLLPSQCQWLIWVVQVVPHVAIVLSARHGMKMTVHSRKWQGCVSLLVYFKQL